MKNAEFFFDSNLLTYKVRGVINMCEEYGGPTHKYKKLGIEQLHLPTTDHFEPTVEDMKVKSILIIYCICPTL